MIRRALVVLLIAGCSFSVTPQVLPNVKLEKLPDSTVTTGGTTTVEAESKQPAAQPQKKWLANLVISSAVTQGTGLSSSGTCVQLAELPSQAVVVDFASGKCPTGDAVVSVASLIFTSSYAKVATQEYVLRRTNDSGELIEIGKMILDSQAGTVTLAELCSGTVQTNCYVQSQSGTLKGILIY